MLKQRILAWAVHGYTALGLVASAGIAVALLDPRPASFRWAFWLMLIATLIDATDGTLARLANVKKVLPGFDGARLDDIIDFQTYTGLPLLLILQAGLLPPGQEFWLVGPFLASAYGFCQVEAKTSDGFFKGFPSYWNIVAFYLYVLQPPAAFNLAVVLLFAILTFVPSRYLYPSQGGRLNQVTNVLAAAWCVLLLLILLRLPDEPPPGRTADAATRLMALISTAFPLYYLAVSWILSVRRFRAPVAES
jgi:phosphatidylcholine synthase